MIPPMLKDNFSQILDNLSFLAYQTILRGRGHYNRVKQTPIRVTVTGTRGKSTVVRWLNEILVNRGHETYAKVTGNYPISYHNLNSAPISRDGVTRLYENAVEFAEYHPVDAAIIENQGIHEYTTRIANEYFCPQVIILVNIRRDHLSTLGEDLGEIARVFTRVMPEDATIVSGDRNEAINAYLRREFLKTGHKFRVARPEGKMRQFNDVFGAESALVVNEALRELGVDPLEPDQVQKYIDSLHDDWGWQHLNCGELVANGAMMNDIESTELLRQFLIGRIDKKKITPLIYTRRDRAGRTASFIKYLNWLQMNSLISRIHAAGTQDGLLKRRVDAPVVQYGSNANAEVVLDSALSEGSPVYLMGNTVADFMRELTNEIDSRTVE